MLAHHLPLTFPEKTIPQNDCAGLFPTHFRKQQLCLWPTLATVMLLGSSKSLPLITNATKSMTAGGKNRGKKKRKKNRI